MPAREKRTLGQFALFFPLTLGHFFLFCNLFRIRRSYELTWTLIFLLNIGFWLYRWELNWPLLLAIQMPITLGLVLLEMRSPRYHGVLWQRVNPDYEAKRLPRASAATYLDGPSVRSE